MTYADAVRAIGKIVDAERADPKLSPLAYPRFCDHGDKAARSIVLFHGFTNCPQQMVELGEAFFAQGYNVLVPRIPRHGMRDRLTRDIGQLTVDELEACCSLSVLLAQALGERVYVLGLSLGGVMAAWLAQFHDLDTAVALSPFFALPRVPKRLSDLIGSGMAAAPSFFSWWDPRVRAECLPLHAYPRFSSHALAASLLLGKRVREAARSASPRAARTIVVTNAQEPACNNAVTAALVRTWRAHGPGVEERVFSNVGRRHDILEPVTFPQARFLVYPRLLEWAAN